MFFFVFAIISSHSKRITRIAHVLDIALTHSFMSHSFNKTFSVMTMTDTISAKKHDKVTVFHKMVVGHVIDKSP